MWQCVKCREQLDDSFDSCWNCGTSKEGIEDPAFQKADEIATAKIKASASQPYTPSDLIGDNPLSCPRCDRKLDYVGSKMFHEGTRWGAFGDLGELFVNKEKFDVYCCPRCGRVEFFVDGIGEEFRPH
jgi:hypothetical protein